MAPFSHSVNDMYQGTFHYIREEKMIRLINQSSGRARPINIGVGQLPDSMCRLAFGWPAVDHGADWWAAPSIWMH
jgi:hypothetical protein